MRDPSQNVPISYGEKHGHQYQFLFVIGGESIGSRGMLNAKIFENQIMCLRAGKLKSPNKTANIMAKRKGQKEKQRSTKHAHKSKDRVTRSLPKTGGELRCSDDLLYKNANDVCEVLYKDSSFHLVLV